MSKCESRKDGDKHFHLHFFGTVHNDYDLGQLTRCASCGCLLVCCNKAMQPRVSQWPAHSCNVFSCVKARVKLLASCCSMLCKCCTCRGLCGGERWWALVRRYLKVRAEALLPILWSESILHISWSKILQKNSETAPWGTSGQPLGGTESKAGCQAMPG